jgi:hypothetical protein
VLTQIEIHEGTSGLVNIDVFAVGDDSHDGCDAMTVLNFNGFANRILSRPIFFGHEMIDDDHFGRFRGIGQSKHAPS